MTTFRVINYQLSNTLSHVCFEKMPRSWEITHVWNTLFMIQMNATLIKNFVFNFTLKYQITTMSPHVCAYLQLLPISSTCFSLFLKKKEWETHHFLRSRCFSGANFLQICQRSRYLVNCFSKDKLSIFLKFEDWLTMCIFACQTLFTYVIVYDWC